MNVTQVENFLRALGVTRIKENNGWINCSCPMAVTRHSGKRDRKPSFGVSVSPVSGYHCFGCGVSGGSLMSLVRMMESVNGRSYEEAMRLAMLEFDPEAEALRRPAAARPPVADRDEFELFPKASQSGMAMSYLLSRKIIPDTADAFDLRWDKKEGRVLLPLKDEAGEFYGAMGRSVEPGEAMRYRCYWMEGRRSAALFGEHRKATGKVILVEGSFSVLHLHQVAPEIRAVCCMGASISKEHVVRLTEWGLTNKPLYLWLDRDKAGKDARDRIAQRMADLVLLMDIPYPSAPAEYAHLKDPAELFEAGMDADGFKTLFDAARVL